MGILLAGLADHRLLVREATEDRLHQTARTPLFPESGYLTPAWSRRGAGRVLVGRRAEPARDLHGGTAPRVRAAGEGLLAEAGVPGGPSCSTPTTKASWSRTMTLLTPDHPPVGTSHA